MLKMFLNDFCECDNNYLLYMGDYTKRGPHWSNEPYLINCYYCSKCGKELQVYHGYHDQETKKLYEESLKYSFINKTSPFVKDVTKINREILTCSLEDKRSLIYDINNENGISLQHGLQVVLTYKKKNSK